MNFKEQPSEEEQETYILPTFDLKELEEPKSELCTVPIFKPVYGRNEPENWDWDEIIKRRKAREDKVFENLTSDERGKLTIWDWVIKMDEYSLKELKESWGISEENTKDKDLEEK